MPRSDIVVSSIRTWTPVVIGAALTWLGVHAGIVIDEQASTALIAGVQALVTSAYYAAFRLLERRWPALGWFLGVAKTPNYDQTVKINADDMNAALAPYVTYDEAYKEPKVRYYTAVSNPLDAASAGEETYNFDGPCGEMDE